MKRWFWIILFVIIPIPWVIIKFLNIAENATLTAILSGIAIISSSFLLSWIAEVAQKDIPKALALAAVALIAVLPEYAVDMYFAWMAGKNPLYTQYALANMTGSNRLLIGLGWAFVVFIFYMKTRKKSISLSEGNTLEINHLVLASIYSLLIPLKGNLQLYDAIILLLIFVSYIYKSGRSEVVEIDIHGPHEALANLPSFSRKLTLLALLIYSAFIILISAEPFAEGLIATGKSFGIDEFLLVQWVAPIASESPEFIIAGMLAFQGHPTSGMTCLISSKVNQWTLLVGMLPVVFMISSGRIAPMILDLRQTEEVFLTAAQSIFAIAVIADLRFSLTDAVILFTLFVTQLFFTTPESRYIFSIIYCILAVLFIVLDKKKRDIVIETIYKKHAK